MFSLIKILSVVTLLSQINLSKAYSQEVDSNFFYRNNIVEATVAVSGFGNKLFQGNILNSKLSIHQKITLNKVFFGVEGFGSKSGSYVNDKILVSNSNKSIVAGIGLTTGLLKSTKDILIDTRINFGISHISQTSDLILPDLFGYLKFNQIQNDWLSYLESTWELIRNSNIFNRLLLGIRYEYPLESIAHASVNGSEIQISPNNRKNLQLWLELGIHCINITNYWRIGGSVYSGYKHVSQNKLNLYQIGFLVIIDNKYGKIVELGYTQESIVSRKARPVNSCYLKIDMVNFGRGL